MNDGKGNPQPSWQHSARANAAAELGFCAFYAGPWAVDRSDEYTSAPFADSNPSQLSGNTFATGAAYDGGFNFPTAPNPYAWGPAPFVDLDLPQVTENVVAAGTAYNHGIAFPTAPDPYALGPAPFVNTNPPQSTESTFAAGTAYNHGIAFPTVPSAYASGLAVATGPTHPHPGAGFQYHEPSFPMTGSFAAANNGNGYHGQLPAPGFNTQLGAAVGSPNTVHTTDNVFPFPGEIREAAPPRPTCATCNRSFGRQADLVRHAKKHQDGPRKFRCPVVGCAYGNYRKDKLREHVRRHGPAAVVSATQF